jgi:nudix-type nucleoside diphosphatase (YffH/AdpP family)
MTLTPRIRIHDVKVLSDDWYVLKKTTFDFQRRDGTWQRQSRETYDRGNGATILLYNLARRTIVLTRQFRFPAYVNGWDDVLIETPAGLLDDSSPEECIRAETEEETGYRVDSPRKVFEAYMSPGSVTEKLFFYVASYERSHRVNLGGGVVADGEDIDTFEIQVDEALAMIGDGRIVDGKTIMLIQHAVLFLFSK